jgi:hypothetical protein
MHVNSAAQLVGLPPASGKLPWRDPLRSDWAVQYTNRSSATAAPRVARRQTAHLGEKPLRAGGAFAAHTRGTLTQVLRQNLEERRVVIRKEVAGKQARRKPDPQPCIGVGAQCCLRLSGVGGIARVVTVQHGGDARRDQPQVLIDRVEVRVESRLSQDLADPGLERVIGRAQPEPSQPTPMRMRVDETRDDPVPVAADLQRPGIGGHRISGCAHTSDFAVADQDRGIGNRRGARSASISEGQRSSNSQHRSITTENIVHGPVHLPLLALTQAHRIAGVKPLESRTIVSSAVDRNRTMEGRRTVDRAAGGSDQLANHRRDFGGRGGLAKIG